MNTSTYYILKNLAIFTLILFVISCSKEQSGTFSDDVKLSLRHAGHNLLLNNNDSTSVVKPVIALDNYKYQLTFENTITIHPDSLVNQIKASFLKSNLPQQYLVEVLQCEDNEVAYSYAMNQNEEKGIIPCRGRQLHEACYSVTVKFTEMSEQSQSDFKYLYLLGLGLLLLLAFIIFKRNPLINTKVEDQNFSSIGRFKFYPEQNKLVKQATEISLSKKECELLALFVAQPNQIIKRDTLMKKVWEDNGVIVGRSLDTYISKLRKKLQDDSTIKLTNVHGVGYKLELNSKNKK